MTITDSGIAALPVPSINVAPVNTVVPGALCWVKPSRRSSAIAIKATMVKITLRAGIIFASLR